MSTGGCNVQGCRASTSLLCGSLDVTPDEAKSEATMSNVLMTQSLVVQLREKAKNGLKWPSTRK